ncbi:hypothetical protein SAMN05216328_13619 [Ensifer sp. YR511]|nr:hypothetical protein SAMN05216328_13619 [Ensifer sp. YR511]
MLNQQLDINRFDCARLLQQSAGDELIKRLVRLEKYHAKTEFRACGGIARLDRPQAIEADGFGS